MIEILIVAVLVLWSSLVVFKKVFPKTHHAVFLAASQFCQNKSWDKLAQWLKPNMVEGCGGNCACPVIEDKDSKKAQLNTVKWK